MKYYPIFVDLTDKRVLIVGGGPVAERKTDGLLKAGARVTVISPTVTDTLKALGTENHITVHRREYRKGDIDGYTLVIAATDSETVNDQVYSEAQAEKALVNIVDRPQPGCFIAPAIVERGDLVCALSSSGKSPFFIKQLKHVIDRLLYDDLGDDLEALASIRAHILSLQNLSEEDKKREFTHKLQPEIDKILRKLTET